MNAAITPAAVLAALAHHIGRNNGVTAARLAAEAAGLDSIQSHYAERQLREIVVALRLEGHHVCATPEHGYFLAANAEELDATCLFLHERAMTTLKQIAAMKRISLPDLRGQLHLPT